MPNYEYICKTCRDRFEVTLPVNRRTKTTFCKCGSSAKRIISVSTIIAPGCPTYESRAEADTRRMVAKNKRSYNLIDE